VSSKSDFFEERQGAAVLKHGILRRYLPPFTGKLGSTSRDGRVAYLDGYAGSGTYESGAKGSPLLAAEISERMEKLRQLECHLVEKDVRRCEELGLAVAGAERCFIYNARIEECVDEVAARTAGVPLFAFLDPFGLPPPMDFIRDKILHRHGPTELLVNITLPGIWRNAGHLKDPTTDYLPYLKGRPKLLAKMDLAMDGGWWRDVWSSGAEDRAHEIFLGYVDRLSPGWAYFWTAVPKRWEGPPVYYLLFLTRHRDGLWEFNNALSSALEEFLEWNVLRSGGEQQALFGEIDRDTALIETLRSNLERVAAEGNGFTPQSRMRDVFDGVIGQAREKHLRRALKDLQAEGKLLNDSKGDLQRKLIMPAP
jgi:three-Cys-motif partner protein